MDLVTMVLRTIFVYFFVLTLMRMMGKREIGKLSLFDLVVSIMMAELAVISIEDPETPLIVGVLPIFVLFCTQMIMSFILLKSEKIRTILDGKPSVIIENGQIREEEMKKQRYNLDDLLMQLRENQVHSVNQVEFAILEPSGKLTVFPKDEEQDITKKDLGLPVKKFDMPVILIKDGDVKEEALQQLGKNHLWLKQELKKRVKTSNYKHISFCSVDHDGKWYVDLKDRPYKR